MQEGLGKTASIIEAFERTTRRFPLRTCFTYVDDKGAEIAYSYREVRMLAAALAWHLRHRGVTRGASVAVDLTNGPMFVLLVLAAAYGGFSLVTLNHRLTSSEKLTCLLELKRSAGVTPVYQVDEGGVHELYDHIAALLAGEDARTQQSQRQQSARRFRDDATLSRPRSHTALSGRAIAAAATARSTRALGRAKPGREARRRQGEMERQDAVELIIHFAERSSRTFNIDARALVMFTSGSTGKPKAVPLTWSNLCGAALASNRVLNQPGVGVWQVTLPMFHVGGFQTVVRSFLNETPFVIYQRFDAQRVLLDADQRHTTHISVVDKMLQDMLQVVEKKGAASQEAAALRAYRCVLLGGAAANPRTLERAVAAGAQVVASYGMTETSSQIANSPVGERFDGALKLLPGYMVRVVDPDSEGFGKLAVRGPGVTSGYLNAHTPKTIDGYLLTGDTAAFEAGQLYLRERTQDMFVSGGENVYPAQIRNALLRLPEVTDAYVFGAPDETWGRRPVAFVESTAATLPSQGDVLRKVSPLLSKLYLPREVYVTRRLPRTGIGKIDRMAVERRWEQRIDVESVTLYRIRVPFKTPFATAKGVLSHRESLLVEVRDREGRTGLGECVAFETDWYLPETLDEDERVLREVLAPAVVNEIYLHPSYAAASFASKRAAANYPLARGALEPALWDLYGKISGKPLWRLIGGVERKAGADSSIAESDRRSAEAEGSRAGWVPAGAVVGLGSAEETVRAVERCVQEGYRRVKLKVAPGRSVEAVRAVRKAFPQLVITLDANQSFVEADRSQLRQLDECGAAWIEEPLNPARVPAHGSSDILARLARLQRWMKTPICLDESLVKPGDAARALRFPELRCFALKIAKWGGVQPALEFAAAALERGCTVWMGGMYDTGISKRLHAAFEVLPGIDAPGDIGSSSRYFPVDVCDPPYEVSDGLVQLNPAGHACGIGCDLNRDALKEVLVRSVTIHA